MDTNERTKENNLWLKLEVITKSQKIDTDDIKPSLLIAELVKYSDEHTVLEGIGEMLDDLIKENNDDDDEE